jgi:hypothetical protein
MTRPGHDGIPPQGPEFAEYLRRALHATEGVEMDPLTVPWAEMEAGNHQNFPAKQTQIASVSIQTIGASSIKTPIDKCDIPEGEGTTSDGGKTSCAVEWLRGHLCFPLPNSFRADLKPFASLSAGPFPQ